MRVAHLLASLSFVALLGIDSASHADNRESWPVLDSHSPRPSAQEWKDATPVSLTRSVGERAKQCTSWRVREWLKLHCSGRPTAAVNLVGGEARQVYFWVEPPEEGAAEQMPGDGEVVMAVNPGTARVVQFWTFGPGYDGPLTVLGDVILQQKWEEDAPAPTFILTDTLVEPVRTATQEGK